MEKQNMNLLNMKAILRDIKRKMRPHTKFDAMQVDNYVYQFEGELANGVTFDGRHSLPEEGIAESAFIYLQKNGKELGVITTENGFVKQAPNRFWHGRNIGGGIYTEATTAIAFYSPKWDAKNGTAYQTYEEKNGKVVNLLKIYCGEHETPNQAIHNVCDAIYHTDIQAKEGNKLRHFILGLGKTNESERVM